MGILYELSFAYDCKAFTPNSLNIVELSVIHITPMNTVEIFISIPRIWNSLRVLLLIGALCFCILGKEAEDCHHLPTLSCTLLVSAVCVDDTSSEFKNPCPNAFSSFLVRCFCISVTSSANRWCSTGRNLGRIGSSDKLTWGWRKISYFKH